MQGNTRRSVSGRYRLWLSVSCVFHVLVFGFAGAFAEAQPLFPHPMYIADVGTTIPGARIMGVDPGEGTGSSIAGAGDVNGDGFADVLLAAFRADPGGRTDAGRVYLFYGVDFTFAGAIDLANPEQVTGVTRFDGISALDILGTYSGGISGIGDFNQDGYGDIMLGAPMPDNTAGYGVAYLVLGRQGILGVNDVFDLTTLDGTNGIRFDGPDVRSYFGGMVSGTGDVNGDSYDDFIVQAMWADPLGRTNAGETHVVYGGPTLPGSGGSMSINALTATQGVSIPGKYAGDHSGQSVSGVGDVNGDGIKDFIIGAPRADPQGRTDAGESYLVYGSASGIGSGGSFDLFSLNGVNGVRIDGRNAGDCYNGTYIGIFCAEAGDVNGDGYGDVLVAAEYADSQGMVDSGEAYLIYGKAGGIGTGGVLDLRSLDGTNGVRIESERENDKSMRYVSSIGDINGDGFADIALGNPFHDYGRVYIIYGAPSLGAGGIFRVADIDGINGVLVIGVDPGSTLGLNLSGAGDVSGDGLDDMVMGALWADPLGRTNAGEAYLVLGRTNLPSATYRGFARTGLAHESWIGDIGDGTMPWGSSRLAIGFADGSGPGYNGASLQTVTLHRTHAVISNFGNGSTLDIADVAWEITTNRTAWTSATLTFHYVNHEIQGLSEDNLSLYQAPSLSGPWTEVPIQLLDAQRNNIHAVVSSLGFFAIRDTEIIPPSVTVNQGVAQEDPVNMLPIVFDVHFSESVLGFSAADVSMGGTATGVTVHVEGESADYFIVVTDVTGDGTLVPTIPANTCTDLVGNPNTASTSTDNSVTLDRQSPTVSLTSIAPNPLNFSPIPLTITFSEEVVFFESSDLICTNATIANFAGSGMNYNADVIPTNPGPVIVQIAANAAIDLAGNGNLHSALFQRTYDNVPPTVSMSSAEPEPTSHSPIYVVVNFSEPVLGFSLSDILTVNGIAGELSGSGSAYTFLLTPLDEGVVSAEIVTDAVVDLAGNSNVSGAFLARTYDSERPTVSMTSPAPDPTANPYIPVTVQFSKDIVGFAADDLVTSNAVISNFMGNGRTFTFDLTIVSQGIGLVSLPENAVEDTAGNGNMPGHLSRLYEDIPPEAFLDSPAPSPTNMSVVPVIVTFTEPVTGLQPAGFGVFNCIVTNLSGSGADYTFDLSPIGQGEMVVWLMAGVCLDSAGTPNLISTPLRIFYDGLSPTVSMTSSVPYQTNTTNPIPITITFSEVVTDFDVSDLVVSNAMVTNFSGGGVYYSCALVPTSEGLVSAGIPANQVYDAAGNGNIQSSISRVWDITRPTVSLFSPAANPTNGSPIPIFVTFSEPVTGFALSDIVLHNGTASALNGSGENYNFNVIPSGQGQVTVSIGQNAVHDGAGNANTGSAPLTRIYDSEAPGVTMISTAPQATNVAPIEVTVIFTESVSGFDAADIQLENGILEGFTGEGAQYDFLLAPVGQGLVRAEILAGVAQDGAGNLNVDGAILSRIYDTVPPTIVMTSTAPDPTHLSPILLTVAFSEPVVDFSLSTLTLQNCTASDFSGSDDSYSVNLYPLDQGLVTAEISALVVHDEAGNANPLPAVFSREYDAVNPSVHLTSAMPDPTNTVPIPVDILFSKPVLDFSDEDVQVQNGILADFSGSGASYSCAVFPVAEGAVIVSVPADVATDGVGNPNVASAPLIRNYDITPPNVLSIIRTGNVNTNATEVTFLVNFDEAVQGFDIGDVAVDTATIAGAYVSEIIGTGSTYYVVVNTGNGDGPLSIDVIDDDSVFDLAQNALGGAGAGNGSMTDGEAYLVDKTPPSLTLQCAAGAATNDPFIWVQLIFSESVWGLDAQDIQVVNGAVGALQGYDATYNLKILFDLEGLTTVTVPAMIASDPAGNGNEAGYFEITYDTTPPTISLSAPSSSSTSGSPIVFVVTYDGADEITLCKEDILLQTTGTVACAVEVLYLGPNERQIILSDFEGNGNISLSIQAGTAWDAAGNMALSAGPASIVTVESGLPLASLPLAILLAALGLYVLRKSHREHVEIRERKRRGQ